jgi:hypothetical protein
MFILLLAVTFVLAVTVSWIVTRLFNNPIEQILDRIIGEAVAAAWARYLTFAIYVVGISGGVRVWTFERYLVGPPDGSPTELTPEVWTMEVYRAIVGTLQSVAWMLLVFFVFALIAFVIVKGRELKHKD